MIDPASFHECQFPPDLSYGATGGPGFKTQINTMGSGYEQRNVLWSRARGVWNAATSLKRQTEFQKVLNFHYARMGMAYGFRWKDWFDYSFAGQLLYCQTQAGQLNPYIPQILSPLPDNTSRIFQLMNHYDSSPVGLPNTYVYHRQIVKPCKAYTDPLTGAVYAGEVIYLNGVSTGAYTIDYTTGLVTMSTPPRTPVLHAPFYGAGPPVFSEIAGGSKSARDYRILLTYYQSAAPYETLADSSEFSFHVDANKLLVIQSPPSMNGADHYRVYICLNAAGALQESLQGYPLAFGAPYTEDVGALATTPNIPVANTFPATTDFVTADAQFDLPARFNQDQLISKYEAYDTIDAPQIEIYELKP